MRLATYNYLLWPEQSLHDILLNKDTASQFVHEWGSKCAEWVPVLEQAINGVQQVCEACPWIQTSKATYDVELMQAHLQALRLGFCSGLPFHSRRLQVFPLAWHSRMYPEHVLHMLHEELYRLHETHCIEFTCQVTRPASS